MSYYHRHLFFCCNQRDQGRRCCADAGATRLRLYCKKRLKELGEAGPGRARANTSGCLDRCEEGPVLVIYPEAVWYTYSDRDDIDEIIDKHVLHGHVVERLRI